MDLSLSSPVEQPRLVVQHNALINARFNLTELESRLMLALMLRIKRHDKEFTACRVPIMELALEKSTSGSMYERVRRMIKDLSTRSILINLDRQPRGGRRTQPDYKAIPLLAYAEYQGGKGHIEARFNDLLVPFLLDLCENFTKAELVQLLKLRSSAAHRIYWLLREYAVFGTRTFALQELREVLGLASAPAYDRWDNFRTRIVDKAQRELAETDLPFSYKPIKNRSNGAVEQICFSFARRVSVAEASVSANSDEVAATGWQALLAANGLAPKSIKVFEEQMAAQRLDEAYIRFVVTTVRQRAQAGKVDKVGGAIYKALTDGYYRDDYAKTQVKTAPNPTLRPRSTQQRTKLLNELEGLRNSLKFMQTESTEPEEKRTQMVQDIQRTIVAVEQQLTQLA